eukprot:PhM_4_TR5895/c0_g4_i6/m.67471
MFFRLTLRESRKHGGRKQVRGCDCCHQRASDVRVLHALNLRHEEIDGTITGVPAARVEALEQDAVCNRRRQRRESVEARFMRGGVLAEVAEGLSNSAHGEDKRSDELLRFIRGLTGTRPGEREHRYRDQAVANGGTLRSSSLPQRSASVDNQYPRSLRARAGLRSSRSSSKCRSMMSVLGAGGSSVVCAAAKGVVVEGFGLLPFPHAHADVFVELPFSFRNPVELHGRVVVGGADGGNECAPEVRVLDMAILAVEAPLLPIQLSLPEALFALQLAVLPSIRSWDGEESWSRMEDIVEGGEFCDQQSTEIVNTYI